MKNIIKDLFIIISRPGFIRGSGVTGIQTTFLRIEHISETVVKSELTGIRVG